MDGSVDSGRASTETAGAARGWMVVEIAGAAYRKRTATEMKGGSERRQSRVEDLVLRASGWVGGGKGISCGR
jgi:hypothetical protein